MKNYQWKISVNKERFHITFMANTSGRYNHTRDHDLPPFFHVFRLPFQYKKQYEKSKAENLSVTRWIANGRFAFAFDGRT